MYLLEIGGRLNKSRETLRKHIQCFHDKKYLTLFPRWFHFFSSSVLHRSRGEKIKDIQLDLASQIHHPCFSVLSNFGSTVRPSFLDLCCQSKLCRCGLPARTHFLTLSCFLQKRTHGKLSSQCCPHQLWKPGDYCIPYAIVSPGVSRRTLTTKSMTECICALTGRSPSLTAMPHWGVLMTHSKYGNPLITPQQLLTYVWPFHDVRETTAQRVYLRSHWEVALA